MGLIHNKWQHHCRQASAMLLACRLRCDSGVCGQRGLRDQGSGVGRVQGLNVKGSAEPHTSPSPAVRAEVKSIAILRRVQFCRDLSSNSR
jgi:hypothetical protein